MVKVMTTTLITAGVALVLLSATAISLAVIVGLLQF
jgi:hypothetical protein